MSESHLAKTLFSQPTGAGTPPVRKKSVRSAEEVEAPLAPGPSKQELPADPASTVQAKQLATEVAEWRKKCAELEASIKAYQHQIAQAEALASSLQKRLDKQIAENCTLQADYQQAQLTNQELEAKIAQQLSLMFTGSDASSDPELRQTIGELQEQILHQASQINEYQTAVQHWKDQSLKHQHHAIQLSSAIERLLAEERPPKRTKANPPSAVEPEPSATLTTKNGKVELPSFLTKLR